MILLSIYELVSTTIYSVISATREMSNFTFYTNSDRKRAKEPDEFRRNNLVSKSLFNLNVSIFSLLETEKKSQPTNGSKPFRLITIYFLYFMIFDFPVLFQHRSVLDKKRSLNILL